MKLTVSEKHSQLPENHGWVWTSYFTDVPDAELLQRPPYQRCEKGDVSYLFTIASSCYYHKLPLKVFVDEKHLEIEAKLKEKGFHVQATERNVRSAKDQRFFSYLKAISQLKDDDLLIIVDCSDVLIKRDPFPYLAKIPGLIFGEDIQETPAIVQNKPIVEKFKLLLANKMLTPKDIDIVNKGFLVNGGVLAGRVCHIKICLQMICSYLSAWQGLSQTLYMPAINLVANQIELPVWVGKPFSSSFKSSELSSSYYVVHR